MWQLAFRRSDLWVILCCFTTTTIFQLMLCKLSWTARWLLAIPIPPCQGPRLRDDSRWLRVRNAILFLHFLFLLCASITRVSVGSWRVDGKALAVSGIFMATMARPLIRRHLERVLDGYLWIGTYL
ncbi:hypothetical protein CONLIGDRAFT_169800 [Coniochaeta ligniaria NRRL 30616]|uniref:Uncharacterized protein n=1 Tax=Coniochaeta ligniaria NRRL 30616 TaxID=1408157 RepID=A0A1J7JZP2_9PEZI|nr:hypothetical protein CONLIGDRAFT_169800 [Coniochaeta ligniaria NRRL 30616]